MTFPTPGTARAYNLETTASSWTPYTGASDAKGTIIVVSSFSGTSITTSTPGWTKLGELTVTFCSAVFYSTTATTTITLSGTGKWAAVVLPVTNGGIVSGTAIDGTAGDPTTHSIGSPRDVLWVEAYCTKGSDVASASSGYSGLTQAPGAAGSSASVSLAYKTATASSENPGVMAGASSTSTCWTLALYRKVNKMIAGGFI